MGCCIIGYADRPYYNVRTDGNDMDIRTGESADSRATRSGVSTMLFLLVTWDT